MTEKLKRFMALALVAIVALSTGLHAADAGVAATAPTVEQPDKEKLSAALDNLTKELDAAAKQIVDTTTDKKEVNSTMTQPATVEQSPATAPAEAAVAKETAVTAEAVTG